MKYLLVSFLFAVALSCSGGASNCMKGSSVACACTDGRQGAQMCQDDGSLGQCVCTGGSTGSGGSTTGSGGAGGHGGAGGSATGTGGQGTGTGGSGTGTGGSGGQSQYMGTFTITYAGGPTKNVSTCYYCSAIYTASTNTGTLSWSYNNGTVGVSLQVRPAKSGGGYEVAPGLGDNDTAMAARFRGDYVLPGSGWVPLTGSCVNLTQLDLQSGGTVAGSMNCTLSGGGDTTPIQATVQGTFQSTFPQ